MPRTAADKMGGVNVAAYADMTAWCEGTSTSKYTKDDGYDVVVGGVNSPNIFTSYERHPNILVTVSRDGKLKSTAAGRYQALFGTWQEVVDRYGFKGRFTPEAQDLFFVKKLMERKAYDDVVAGRIAIAIQKCNKEWASFFGSPYNQRTHTLEEMIAKYKSFGGKVA